MARELEDDIVGELDEITEAQRAMTVATGQERSRTITLQFAI